MDYRQSVLAFHEQLPADRPTGFSRAGQLARFAVFEEELDPIEDDSVLDFGCGLGDFFEYLMQISTIQPLYTGVDFNDSFIAAARQRHAHGRRRLPAFTNRLLADEIFDVVVASGAFCYLFDHVMEIHRETIAELWVRTRRVLMFNVLAADQDNPPVDKHVLYDAEDLVRIPWSLDCRRWKLRRDYLPNDMTMIMYK